ncbi:MAG: hypothetical protein J6S14_01350 [Clostridia bacterium]|nr:hypothetical protein [Clostridia bacterium]
MEELELQKETTAPAVKNQLDYMSGDSLNKAYKNAQILAKSDLVPETYRNRPDNVLLAMDMASRTGFSLMQVMQNLYLVKGKPAWSGQFCMSAIKASGLYDRVQYMWCGEPDTPEYGCYVTAIDRSTGQRVNGAAVTWAMVRAEGWDKKPGSKWMSMPELMFRYRAAALFARTECPDVLQGLHTQDENQDVYGYDEPKKSKTKITLGNVIDAEAVETEE